MSDIEDEQNVQFVFIWKVENALYAREYKRKELTSPTFTPEVLVTTECYLELIIRGTSDHDHCAISCNLRRIFNTSVSWGYRLSFIRADGSIENSLVEQNVSHDSSREASIRLTTHEITGENRLAFLPCGTLTIQCEIWVRNPDLNSEPVVCFARSHVGVERRFSTWDIEKFSTLVGKYKRTLVLKSAMEEFPPLSAELFVTGGSTCDEKIEIHIILKKSVKYGFMTLGVSVLDFERRAYFHTKDESVFGEKNEQQIWRFLLAVEKNKLVAYRHKFLPDDVLSLKCDFEISLGEVSTCIERITTGPCGLVSPETSQSELERHSSSSLSEELRRLFEEGSLSDMKVRVGDESFSVHTAVLGARSTVFKAMFGGEMKEKWTGSVDIEDFAVGTVRRLLTFMYTDSVGEVRWETAFQLYEAADKYDVVSLKEKCSAILKDSLSLSNVCQILILADMHHDQQLKDFVLDFIQIHDKEILNSEEWKELEQRSLQLTCETLRRMYEKKMEF